MLITRNENRDSTSRVSQWISVDERLPEIHKHYRSKAVLVVADNGDRQWVSIDWYQKTDYGDCWCVAHDPSYTVKVTHWQPLPALPHEGNLKRT